MSTNVTSITGAAGGSLWGEVEALTDALHDIMGGMPGDELPPGYRMSQETRTALESARPLLERALELLEAVHDQEERRYAGYCEAYEEAQGHA